MNPNRWTSPVLPALLAVAAGLSLASLSVRAQAAPGVPPSDAQIASTAPSADDVIRLSPFQVDASKDKGYFAENTLAGSRIKTNLADIAASVTVVTKQQMEDTASVDINDIFRYEASTEGSGTYTPVIIDRNTIKDAVAGYSFGNDGSATTNAQANRVRGLSSPDAAINNYSTNNRIPFDSYNIQSVEISRGPNSLLFGLGTPSGVVNTNVAQAMLNRDTNQVQVRTDQNGSYRGSIALNRSLIKDKLAVHVALLYDNRQFERKPSRDLYRRQYGALTFKPFPKTILRGFAENYQNDANRPNSITPRDQVTPWLQSGRPVYDPITRMVTVLDSGTTYGPYVSDTRSPGYSATLNRIVGVNALSATTSPLFVPGIAFDDVARPIRRIDNGSVIDLFARQYQFYRPVQTNPEATLPTATSLGYTNGDPRFLILDRYWSASANLPVPLQVIDGRSYTISGYNYPGVTNRAIYDWTKYNTLQTNFAQIKASNYNLELEQEIVPDLYLNAGWLRQRIGEVDNYTVNQLQGATLGVDTTKNMVDGRANPYFGLPFIYEGAGGGLDTFYAPENDDNYRALLTYKLDFTGNRNWTRWFGHHNLIGTWQEQDAMRRIERWRMNFVGTSPDTQLRYGQNLTIPGRALWNVTATMRHYYMASPGDPQGRVTHSTGFYGNQGWNRLANSSIEVYDLGTAQYVTEPIGETTYFADNGSFKTQREVKGTQAALQSYWWDDRLITTFGARNDEYRARVTTSGIIKDSNTGATIAPAMGNDLLFTNGTSGEINRSRVLSRWTPWQKLKGSTKTLGAAFRPLKNWDFIQNLGGRGSVLGEFLDGLTFYYNESDNFNPPATYQTDYFGNALPKPTGKGKDGGFGFTMLNNKLVARINWYTTTSKNERTTAAGTLLTRAGYSDTTTGIPWASAVLRIHNAEARGQTLAQIIGTTGWNTNAVNDVSDTANQQKIWEMLKLPYNYYAGLQLGATQDSKSHGVEAQITYNPTPNWTMKLTASKDEATYTNVAPQFDAWIAARMPVWTSLTSDIPDFTDYSGRQFSLRNFWTGYGFTNVAQIENTDGNTSPQAYYNNVVVSQIALAKALEGAVTPDQRIYHATFLTNYTFTNESFGGKLKGWSVGGAERWESKAAIGYYGKVGDPTQPTVINLADVTRPIYGDSGNYYTDLWVAYSRKIYHNRVGMKIQLNCNDAFESGRLVPLAVNFDGSRWAYRIIDPRQWILQATFTF
ncbi:MAG TPA: TonB-dependent receptor [Opitutaceae bacterium]|nr:TonB-dependent receptor [Opitutaceae bacterium]